MALRAGVARLAWTDSLLRAEGSFAVERAGVPWRRLVSAVVLGGFGYGLVMGSFGGKPLGGLYSGIKVPLCVIGATALGLPNFYVVNALLGLRADFPAAVRGVLAAQGTLALTLLALAPVTATLYLAGMSYPSALLVNAGLFLVATLAAQRSLARHYRPLIARRPRHARALVAWFALYAFVSIKLGWVLRPFVGDPDLETSFLRAGRWMDDPFRNLFWAAAGLLASLARRVVGD